MYLINKINLFFLIKKNKYLIMYHVPRSGGTSIRFFLKKYCGWDSFFTINNFLPLEGSDFAKYKKKIFLGHIPYKNLNLLDKFEFTILRNPIDRYISEYFYNLNFNLARKKKTIILSKEKS